MYVGVSGYGKARVIQFKEDTHVPGTKSKKTRVVKTIGNYEKMLAEDPDIIAKLKAEAKRLTAEKKAARQPLTVALSQEPVLKPDDVSQSFHFGHALVKQLWQQMGLDAFYRTYSGKKNVDAVAQAIYYLVAHRLSSPDSIRASVQDQVHYAGLTPLGQDVFYQVLDVLYEQKETVIPHLCSFFEKKTDRQGPESYYDVTTYSFESVNWGELRMFGFSKDHKNGEVQVVMGLLLDNNGIPITYELFPGNTMDQNTLATAIEDLKERYRLDRIVVVADRGLNGGENLELLHRSGHEFVMGYTLKRAKEELKTLALDDDGWTHRLVQENTGEVLYQDKVLETAIEVNVPASLSTEAQPKKRGRPRKYDVIKIPVKIHVTWSAERARKDKADRDRMVEKLTQRLDKPYQLKADLKRGRNQYLKLEVNTNDCTLDVDKIARAARLDGYYAVVTNNLDYSTSDVSSIYGGLWQIEESFRILKTDLRARPVFVWSDTHIQGHFALCFLCLCILRYAQYLLQTDMNKRVSAEILMDAFEWPLAVVIGEFPSCVVTPTRLTQEYLDLSQILNLPPLKTNMTLTNFRAATKLNLTKNIV